MTVDTPQAAAEERNKLSKALRDSIEEMRNAGLERAEAEHLYQDRYNTALLKSERSSDAQRKAEAQQAAASLSKTLLKAEVIERFWSVRVRAIETDLKALMTVAAGLRREYEDAMRGPNP